MYPIVTPKSPPNELLSYNHIKKVQNNIFHDRNT